MNLFTVYRIRLEYPISSSCSECPFHMQSIHIIYIGVTTPILSMHCPLNETWKKIFKFIMMSIIQHGEINFNIILMGTNILVYHRKISIKALPITYVRHSTHKARFAWPIGVWLWLWTCFLTLRIQQTFRFTVCKIPSSH